MCECIKSFLVARQHGMKGEFFPSDALFNFARVYF